ncbi:hypothetical protein [Amycolatopsis sp. cmx-4-68]
MRNRSLVERTVTMTCVANDCRHAETLDARMRCPYS